MRYLYAYAAALLTLVALDAVWLGWVAKNFYREQIGHLMADELRLGAAVAFYLLYLVGVVVFAVAPALEARSAPRALVLGALFGFFAYMTYDLSNFATLRGWPLRVVLVDIAWGSALSAACAVVGYAAATQAAR